MSASIISGLTSGPCPYCAKRGVLLMDQCLVEVNNVLSCFRCGVELGKAPSVVQIPDIVGKVCRRLVQSCQFQCSRQTDRTSISFVDRDNSEVLAKISWREPLRRFGLPDDSGILFSPNHVEPTTPGGILQTLRVLTEFNFRITEMPKGKREAKWARLQLITGRDLVSPAYIVRLELRWRETVRPELKSVMFT